MDVLGIAYEQFTKEQREAVVVAYPRGLHFKDDIIDAFYSGMKHRPDSTFGTVNDDVLALKDRILCVLTSVRSSAPRPGRADPSLVACWQQTDAIGEQS